MYKTTYDKAECQTGIIHVGYGAFHRAHQAVYIDDYMEKTGDLRWGIVAVNLRNEGFREIDDECPFGNHNCYRKWLCTRLPFV